MSDVLVTFLLLLWKSISKANYGIKGLFWHTVTEEHVSIMSEKQSVKQQAWQQEQEAKISCFQPETQSGEKTGSRRRVWASLITSPLKAVFPSQTAPTH